MGPRIAIAMACLALGDPAGAQVPLRSVAVGPPGLTSGAPDGIYIAEPAEAATLAGVRWDRWVGRPVSQPMVVALAREIAGAFRRAGRTVELVASVSGDGRLRVEARPLPGGQSRLTVLNPVDLGWGAPPEPVPSPVVVVTGPAEESGLTILVAPAEGPPPPETPAPAIDPPRPEPGPPIGAAELAAAPGPPERFAAVASRSGPQGEARIVSLRRAGVDVAPRESFAAPAIGEPPDPGEIAHRIGAVAARDPSPAEPAGAGPSPAPADDPLPEPDPASTPISEVVVLGERHRGDRVTVNNGPVVACVPEISLEATRRITDVFLGLTGAAPNDESLALARSRVAQIYADETTGDPSAVEVSTDTSHPPTLLVSVGRKKNPPPPPGKG